MVLDKLSWRRVVKQPRATLRGGIIPWLRKSGSPPITADTALFYSAFYAAVSIISSSVGVLPLKVLRRLPNGDTEPVPNNPVYRLLHDAPNPEQTPMIFKEDVTCKTALWGNGYSEIERDRVGVPINLWRLPADLVTPTIDSAGQLIYEVNVGSGGPVKLRPDQVLHIPLLGDGLVGKSPVTLARQTISAGLQMEQHAEALFANGAMPGGVLEHPGTLGEKGNDNIRESFESRYRGSSNAGRTLILEEGMKYNSLTMPSDDAQFLESRNFQVQDVARWFRLPPHMLAEMGRATFSNIEELGRWFVSHTMMHWLVRWEEECNRKLLPKNGNLFCKFNVQALLRGDNASRGAFYKIMRDVGAFSVNDILGLEDRNKIGEEGDIRLAPLNSADLKTLLVPPEPEPVDDGGGDDETPDGVESDGRDALGPIMEDAAGRMVRKACKALQRAHSKACSDREEFERLVCEFFQKFESEVRNVLDPVLRARAMADGGKPMDLEREASRFVENCREPVLAVCRSGGFDRIPEYLRAWEKTGPVAMAVTIGAGDER